MAIARVAEPSGSLQDVKEWGLAREDLGDTMAIRRQHLAQALIVSQGA